MSAFITATSLKDNWQTAAEDLLQQLNDLPPEYQCAFIYVSENFSTDISRLLDELKKNLGIQHWVGSIGSGICTTNLEIYDQPAITIMVTNLDAASYQVFNGIDNMPETDADNFSLRFALVHGDPRNGLLPELIEQLPEKMGNGFLAGGMTSSNSQFFQIADDITEGDLSGIIFKDVPILTGLTQGCSPIGEKHVLTSCDHHIAATIDKRPALDVFKEEIGDILARDIDRAAGYIFAAFPVAGSDTGDYLVRNIIGIDPDNGLLAIGDNMKADSPIMFCKRDGQSAIQDMQRMLEDMKKRIGNNTVKGAVYISCLGRGKNLFGDNSEELKMITEVLGEIPLVGFYANGEIAGNRLYGYTGVLTVFL